MEAVKYILKGATGEIEEKKSRFIATVMPVADEEEAVRFINETKKKYWDARHNCSAFVIGEKGEITRCSDDGEPSGTAGRPMLEVLKSSMIRNVAVVVTRYFGGILLGTGGLVRAYTDAVKAGLDNCEVIEKLDGFLCEVIAEYTDLSRLQYIFRDEPFTLKDTIYEDKVRFMVLVPGDGLEDAKEKVIEATNARGVFKKKGSCKYAGTSGEVIMTDYREEENGG